MTDWSCPGLSNTAHIANYISRSGRQDQSVYQHLGGAGRMNIRHIEFSSAIETYPVRPMLDRKQAAHVTVPAPKNELENPHQWVHLSCSRRLSLLPFASSQVRRERILPRASAMEQSAAP